MFHADFYPGIVECCDTKQEMRSHIGQGFDVDGIDFPALYHPVQHRGVKRFGECEKMLKDKTVNPGNIFFLISPAGDIAGTVTYQYADDEDTGYIHMVAIEKNHQGKRLAMPLMLYAVQKIIGDGKKKILLNTDDWRIPAIKTYLHTGFVPVIKDGDTDMENRWRKVYDIIGIK